MFASKDEINMETDTDTDPYSEVFSNPKLVKKIIELTTNSFADKDKSKVLKQLRLVCKSWNQCICEKQAPTKAICIKVMDGCDEQEIVTKREIMEFAKRTFPIQNLSVSIKSNPKNCASSYPNLYYIFENFGADLKYLSLGICLNTLEDIRLFINILSKVSANLEVFYIEGIFLNRKTAQKLIELDAADYFPYFSKLERFRIKSITKEFIPTFTFDFEDVDMTVPVMFVLKIMEMFGNVQHMYLDGSDGTMYSLDPLQKSVLELFQQNALIYPNLKRIVLIFDYPFLFPALFTEVREYYHHEKLREVLKLHFHPCPISKSEIQRDENLRMMLLDESEKILVGPITSACMNNDHSI